MVDWSEALSFIHEYDGGCHTITGVRFTDNGTYMGLFGYNRGQLRDIVLTQAVAADASGPMLRMSARSRRRTAFTACITNFRNPSAGCRDTRFSP